MESGVEENWIDVRYEGAVESNVIWILWKDNDKKKSVICNQLEGTFNQDQA